MSFLHALLQQSDLQRIVGGFCGVLINATGSGCCQRGTGRTVTNHFAGATSWHPDHAILRTICQLPSSPIHLITSIHGPAPYVFIPLKTSDLLSNVEQLLAASTCIVCSVVQVVVATLGDFEYSVLRGLRTHAWACFEPQGCRQPGSTRWL